MNVKSSRIDKESPIFHTLSGSWSIYGDSEWLLCTRVGIISDRCCLSDPLGCEGVHSIMLVILCVRKLINRVD